MFSTGDWGTSQKGLVGATGVIVDGRPDGAVSGVALVR